jgi:putative transposon-encoded protein
LLQHIGESMVTLKKDTTSRETTERSGEPNAVSQKAKFEVFGEEMIEKKVKQSGNSGRVYLPPEWIGKLVKIIRVE